MRLFRAFLIGFGAVLVLLVGALFLLPHVTDLRVLKNELAGRISQVAGRDVRIDGELVVALLPTPGLRVSGIFVAAPGGFGNGSMMQCGSLHVGVDLLALLGGEVSVARFDMKDFIAEFHRDSGGNANWDTLFPGDGRQDMDTPAPSRGAVVLDRPDLFVRNATVSMKDDAAGIGWSLANSGLHLDGDSREYELETVFSARRLPTSLRFKAAGVLEGGLVGGAAVLRDTRLTLDYDLDGPGGAEPAEVVAELAMDVYRGNLNASKVTVSSPGFAATGTVRAEDVYDAWTVKGAWKASSSDVQTLCRSYGLPVPAFAENASSAHAGAEFVMAASMHSLALHNASLSFSDTVFHGELKAEYGNRTRFAVNGTANSLDFSELVIRAGNASPAGGEAESVASAEAAGRALDGSFDLNVEKFKAGNLAGRNLVVDADFQAGRVELHRFNADFDRGGLKGNGSGSIGPGSLDAKMNFTLLGLEQGKITGEFSPLMSGDVRFSHDDAVFSGHVDLKPCNPWNVLWALNVERPAGINPHAVSKVEGAFDFTGEPGKWRVSNLRAVLDRTRIKGRLARMRGGAPAWDFSAQVDSLNLDAWKTHSKQKKTRSLAEDFAWVQGANFKGEVQIGRLVVGKESFKNVRAVLNAGKSVFRLGQGEAEWSGGKGTADVKLAVSGPELSVSGNIDFKGLPVDAVANAAGHAGRMDGTCDAALTGSARGRNAEQLLKTVEADINLHSRKLALLSGNGKDALISFENADARFGIHHGAGGGNRSAAANPKAKTLPLVSDVEFSLTASKARTGDRGLMKFSAGGKLGLEFNAVGELDKVVASRFSARGVPEAFEDGHSVVTLSLSGSAEPSASRGRIDQADVSGPGFTAHARVRGTWGKDWSVEGDLALPDAQPGKLWTALYNEAPRKGEMLKGSVNVAFSKKAGGPADLDVRLGVDDGTLMGRFKVRDFAAPDMDFHIEARDMDFDCWRDPDPEENADRSESAMHWADEVFPISLLRTPSVRGKIKLDNTRVAWVHWGHATMSLQAMLGKMELKASDDAQHGGKADLWLRVRAGRQALTAETSVKMDKVESGRFIVGLAGDTVIRGPVDLDLAASSSGNSWRTLAKNLAGKADLSFHKGAVIPHAAKGKRREIPFESMTGRVNIANGILRNNDMRAEAAGYTATGEGYLNLPEAYLDYTVNARGPAITAVPIAVKGPLDDVHVDVSSLGIFMDSLGRVMSLPLQPLYFLRDLLF